MYQLTTLKRVPSQVTSTKYQSSIKYQVSSIKFQVSIIKYQVSSINLLSLCTPLIKENQLQSIFIINHNRLFIHIIHMA